MPSLKRHFLKTTTGLLAGLLLAGVASAQGFPTKPVTLMIPYPAGGLSDNIARRVNVPLGAALGQPVIVENLGGASGSIAAQKVLNAPMDGYMVFQGSPNELILAPAGDLRHQVQTGRLPPDPPHRASAHGHSCARQLPREDRRRTGRLRRQSLPRMASR
jgi:hypothetical protein